jgi:hypothetical protein
MPRRVRDGLMRANSTQRRWPIHLSGSSYTTRKISKVAARARGYRRNNWGAAHIRSPPTVKVTPPTAAGNLTFPQRFCRQLKIKGEPREEDQARTMDHYLPQDVGNGI